MVAKGKKCSSLYLMQARVIDFSINTVDDDSTVKFWHNRPGHMSEKGLMILAKNNLLSGDAEGIFEKVCSLLSRKADQSCIQNTLPYKETKYA